MKFAERATPVAAAVAAVSTLACCLPLGFLGAVGLAGASFWSQSLRPWLLGSAAVLMGIGFVQLYRGREQCTKAALSAWLCFGALPSLCSSSSSFLNS